MKTFDLNDAKNGVKICTRGGREVEILRFDLKNEQPILAVVKYDDYDEVCRYSEDGKYFAGGKESNLDLFIQEDK